MDLKPAEGHRIHFRRIAAASTVFLIAPEEKRHKIYIVNEDGTNSIRVGDSGTVSAQGTMIPAKGSLDDNCSMDAYWGYAPSSSGTVSGFIVV